MAEQEGEMPGSPGGGLGNSQCQRFGLWLPDDLPPSRTSEQDMRANSGEEGHQIRKRRRGLLRMYYGVDENGPLQEENPLDIDKSGFRSQVFMEKLLKESSLNQLYRQEERIKKEIQELDSNMQYLVYENHSKFIKASETIKEMKDDFQHLEDDMTHLSSRMEEIISSSNSINSALSDRKKEITKLCGVHHLLKKLQFLFELPTRLNKCIGKGFYAQAVRTYSKAQRVLEQYQHMPSFHGIQKDCSAIISQLKGLLWDRMEDTASSTSTVAETVDLLLELNEPAELLCQQYLEKSRRQLEQNLNTVTQEERLEQGASVAEEPSEIMGVQEYVGLVCNGFLANVSLVIQSCFDMFVRRRGSTGSGGESSAGQEAQRSLTSFVLSLMDKCLYSVKERLKREAYHLDSVQLVRALDRVSGKLHAMDQLLPSAELSMKGKELVSYVAEVHTECHCQRLQQSFSDALMSVRHSLATSKTTAAVQAPPLSDHSSTLYAAIKSGLEVSLGNLKEFIESNVGFAMKSGFREEFCMKNVRAGVVSKFISHVLDTCKGFTESGSDHTPSSSFPPTLILILSRLVHDMERSTISYLVSYGDECFPPYEEGPVVATPIGEVLARAKDIAQTLLDHYVKVQGESISQMIRKSVETRDWLKTIEPRNVRSVMKRIVEEVTLIDKRVGALYKEGSKKDQGSEGQGSRHTYNYSLTQGKGYSHMDSSLLSNIQKLFYEKIEVFSRVEFSKLSITTGIIKIFLKAFLECVRLRTFGKFGLQQMQVDAHYLQIYLWRFVYDEQLVRVLLEQVVSSTIERCVEPMTMEQSIVEVVCEKN